MSIRYIHSVMTDINIEQISKFFAQYMIKALSKEDIDAINRCNLSVENEGSCASLAFVNAHLLMVRAFEESTGRQFDRYSKNDFMAFNTAWQLTKEQEFSL